MGLAPLAAPTARAAPLRPVALTGELSVAPGLAVGDAGELGPDLAAKLRALGFDRHLELSQVAREVGSELGQLAAKPRVVTGPVRSRLHRLRCPGTKRVGPRWVAIRDGDVPDRDLVPGDEEPSDGGVVPSVSHDVPLFRVTPATRSFGV